jgi:3'-5' exoribonuclease
MILSHHGKLEYGSPKLPHFPEALMLHYLDDMDSKIECMRALIENDRQVEGCFTAYNAVLERVVLKKDLYLNPPEPAKEAQPKEALLRDAQPKDAQPKEALLKDAQPKDAQSKESAPKPAAASPAPNGSAKPDSAFADKLKQALQPARTTEGK